MAAPDYAIDHPELAEAFTACTAEVQELTHDIYRGLMGERYAEYLSIGHVASLVQLSPEDEAALYDTAQEHLQGRIVGTAAADTQHSSEDAFALAGLDAALDSATSGNPVIAEYETHMNWLSQPINESFGDVAYISPDIPESGFGIVDARDIQQQDLTLTALPGAQEIFDPTYHHKLTVRFRAVGSLIVPTITAYKDTEVIADDLMRDDTAILAAVNAIQTPVQYRGTVAAWLSKCRSEIHGVLGAAIENVYEGVMPQLRAIASDL